MYIAYVLISILEYFVSKLYFFNKKINPVSLYLVSWNLMVGLNQLQLVYTYPITLKTWLTIILFQAIYVFGCCLGSVLKIRGIKINKLSDPKRTLKKLILLLSVIAAIAIVPNFIQFLLKYSLNFMDRMNYIYNDRLMNTRGYEVIPYLGTVSYLAVAISGVYFSEFGFSKVILLPLLLALADTLPGGGRSGLILEISLFVIPILLFKTKNRERKQNRSVSKKYLVLLISGILLIVFWQMSAVRSRWISENQYMSEQMKMLFKISPSIYKTYIYISFPIATLNEYLKHPTYSFGINTFGFFISIINKFGFSLPYSRYQDAFYIPMLTNTATYIRELIQDFSFPGALLVTFFLAVVYGVTYSIAIKDKSYQAKILSGILGTIWFMSFFVWFFRESVFWIMIIVLPICFYLIKDRKVYRL